MGRVMIVAGVDEVGRGPLIGDVVACAVVLPESHQIEGITDSKKLTEKKREYLYEKILSTAIDISIGRAGPEEIDSINILKATMKAMERAVNGLKQKVDKVLIDGNRIPEGIIIPCEAVIKGDSIHENIGAASIIAKVTRDREMHELDKMYPEYGFASHKGYPTKVHLDAINKHGVLPLHRKSFSPIKKALEMEFCS